VPLLTQPGKVSKDYIEGKRQRYSNPFRFYLMVSIVFFLLIGLSESIDKYEALSKESKEVEKSLENTSKKNDVNERKKKLTQVKIDSVKKKIDKELEESYVPKIAREKILEQVENEAKDTIANNELEGDFNFGDKRIDDFTKHIRHNPGTNNVDVALDSLGYEKNFTNRFVFVKTKRLYLVTKNKENRAQFFNEVLSYGSIALFVFLPFFTLFLKLFYIRRKFTYIDHLLFVFHVQTVFFMLFSVFVLLQIFDIAPNIMLFALLFLVYLIIAMKKFYAQSFLKTFFKFILLNMVYFFVAGIGVVMVFLISFAMF
jgi:hypothetical protein